MAGCVWSQFRVALSAAEPLMTTMISLTRSPCLLMLSMARLSECFLGDEHIVGSMTDMAFEIILSRLPTSGDPVLDWPDEWFRNAGLRKIEIQLLLPRP